MKWRDLQPGDVVVCRTSNETCLLLDTHAAGDVSFRWFVLCGVSHTAWGSNPYWIDSDMADCEIEGWDIYRADDP